MVSKQMKPTREDSSNFAIDGRAIGPDRPPYIVAELSGNHGGALTRALELLEACHAAGADAVKLQTYTADSMTVRGTRPEFTLRGGLWDGWHLYDLYAAAQTPWEWHAELFARARQLGVTLFSSPFDDAAVELLESLQAPAYKVASFELVDLPLIRRIATTGKPMILSTGLASAEEIAEAVAAARNGGCNDLALLHCTSAYPAPAEDANLTTIPDMATRFQLPCGLSDHSNGIEVALAAIALGACIIEKHVTLRRGDEGVDSAFSLEPDELGSLVEASGRVWAARGQPYYGPTASEQDSLRYRRSLYLVRDVDRGCPITADAVRAIRPGHGLKPKHLDEVLGRRARRDLRAGEPLDFECLEPAG